MKRIISLVAIVILVFAFSACTSYDYDIANYQLNIENYNADLFMPELSELGDYTEIEYLCKKDESFFPTYLIQLIVKYDEKSFSAEKVRLESSYNYLDEPQKADFDDISYTIPVENFTLAGFDFKVAQFEDTVYPKNFGMVGISEEKQEIAYLWVYAPDLDLICEADEDLMESMINFVEYWFELE